ncbi:MAG: hypothetical protein NT040_08490 [Bacteroidetes bacterium]|nr:hypothetical protein [Bacteroidota bacterium]
MKTNKYFFTSVGFASGLLLGISIIGLLSFSSTPQVSTESSPPEPITSAVANSYYKNYKADAVPLNQVIKGFTIDKTQLDAMNLIARENTALTAFRIYLGRDNNSRTVGIVVGVDNTGKDAVRNSIINTDARGLSPCPPICDVTSPIILDR